MPSPGLLKGFKVSSGSCSADRVTWPSSSPTTATRVWQVLYNARAVHWQAHISCGPAAATSACWEPSSAMFGQGISLLLFHTDHLGSGFRGAEGGGGGADCAHRHQCRGYRGAQRHAQRVGGPADDLLLPTLPTLRYLPISAASWLFPATTQRNSAGTLRAGFSWVSFLPCHKP